MEGLFTQKSITKSMITSTIISECGTLLTEMLGVSSALVTHIKTVRLVERPLFGETHIKANFNAKFTKSYLLMRINNEITANTLLSNVRPRIARHPFAATAGTLELSKASSSTLIRRQRCKVGEVTQS